MVHCLNHCKCILTAPGSTSTSEFLGHCCFEKCNNKYCCNQCDFISDRNYSILRKICKKIFKDYNRSMCREKYAIFEGGNSINIRFHRSGSRGDEIKTSEEDRFGIKNKQEYLSHEKRLKQKQTHAQRAVENDTNRNDGNVFDDKIESAIRKNRKKNQNRKYHEFDENGNDTENIEANRKTGKKSGNREYNKSDERGNGKEKQKFIPRSGKHKQKNNFPDDDIAINGRFEGKATSGHGPLRRRGSEKEKNEENRPKITKITEANKNYGNKVSRLAKIKHGMVIDNDESGEKNVKKGNYKKGIKSKGEKDDISYERGGKRFSKRTTSEKSKVENMGNKINEKLSRENVKGKGSYIIINDLRNKVRCGQKFALDKELNFNIMGKPRNLTYLLKKQIPSRADEVKASDYLRAQMEERELWKQCYRPQPSKCPSNSCNIKLCTQCHQPTAVMSCFSENCKC